MNIHDVSRKDLKLALQYCQETLGYSRFHKEPPKINFKEKLLKKVAPYKKEWGGFDSSLNEITIYRNSHKSYISLIDTFIHEYKHHLQDLRLYEYYHKKYGYDDSPHEKEAEETAREHKWLAKRYIRNHLR